MGAVLRVPMLFEMSARRVTVFVAARHNSVRNALWKLLETEPGVEPVAASADLADLKRLLERAVPHVVVVDEAILGGDGISALSGLIASAPVTAFIVVGLGEHPRYLTRARETGAADYVRLDDAGRLTGAVLAAP
jgi:DNA-binding NarL/FixJ family response regulator